MAAETLALTRPLMEVATEVILGGYGDPTESPLLLDALVQAKEAGCSVRVISGGAKLSPKTIVEMAEAGLDRLVLSMDGARDKTLRALRGVPRRAWLKWIRAARAQAEGLGGHRPLIQLNFVAQWANVHELPELVSLCAREGVAGIHAFHLKAYSFDLANRCLLSEPQRAVPFFDEAQRRAADLGVFLHLPPLSQEPSSCIQPFETLFVRHDGTVRGCCSGLFEPAVFGLEAGRLEEGVAQLWRAPALEQFRKATASGRESAFPTPCRSCAFRKPTLAAHLRPLSPLPVLSEAVAHA